jgi:glycosyltransferase involved in cell wall biosynthesis
VTPHTHAGVWGDSPLDLALYRRADGVVALTDDERARLAALGVREERLRVVGHGVSVRGGGDGEGFRRRHGLTGPVVLFLGRKARYKGYPLLLEAAPALWARVPDAHFVLAGPADAEALPPALAAVRADPRVRDLGFLSDAEREDAFAACDVFGLPSEAEAFGLVVVEAWAYGKPVVARDIPTLRERVGGAGGGLLVPGRADALADALARLLSDAPLRAALGARGRAEAERRTWPRVAQEMAALYGAGRRA